VARQESDREDLIREATALVERIEIKFGDVIVTAGFRANGALSLFFAADPAIQFNSLCQLRRAYSAGKMYKANRGKLISMRKERSGGETALLSQEVPAEDLSLLMADLYERMRALRDALAESRFAIRSQIPEDSPVLERLVQSLAKLEGPLHIADRPHAV
jgi:hypothetical protein